VGRLANELLWLLATRNDHTSLIQDGGKHIRGEILLLEEPRKALREYGHSQYVDNTTISPYWHIKRDGMAK
jgi:hypothetical protein